MSNTAPNKLKAIAADRGEQLDLLIPRVIVETGSVLQAARVLNVSPNSLHHWLKTNNLRVQTTQVTSLVKADFNG